MLAGIGGGGEVAAASLDVFASVDMQRLTEAGWAQKISKTDGVEIMPIAGFGNIQVRS